MVRRTAEITFIDPDDIESQNAKNDLYTQDEHGNWIANEKILHRMMSNNSIIYDEKPTREQLHAHFQKMRHSGEPGIVNLEAAKRRREDFQGLNPCFPGYMSLLTEDGYRTFESLDGMDVKVVNKDGKVTNGTVWYTGFKEIWKLRLSNGKTLSCTGNHVFLTADNEKIEAQNLLGKTLKAYGEEENPVVIEVLNTGRLEKVYDFSEPELHWGVVDGVIAHNCAEILLQSKNVCNLTTTNMMAFVEDGKLDKDALMEATKLSARAGYRMTNLKLELPEWDRNQKHDRLLGVSMTGYQEMVGELDMSLEEQKELLAEMREVAHDAMKEIASEQGTNESLLVTTVKPEGSLSQVFGGVSSGLHFPHSEYYIRRIRINADDPLCKVAEELGWSMHPEVGQTAENATIKVIDFPVHSPAKKFKADVSAVEQLETYKMFQEKYTDHNSSITVHVRDNEWDEVEEWIWNHWDTFIGVSFLSYDDSFYQLLPYEECTKEEYEALKARTKKFVPSMLKKYETTGLSELSDESCADGACAVR